MKKIDCVSAVFVANERCCTVIQSDEHGCLDQFFILWTGVCVCVFSFILFTLDVS